MPTSPCTISNRRRSLAATGFLFLLCGTWVFQSCSVGPRAGYDRNQGTWASAGTPSAGNKASTGKTTPSPSDLRPGQTLRGPASWYGPGFHGKLTASGQKFDQDGLSCAHRTLPFGTRLRVHRPDNGRSVEVLVNDRGPFVGDRILDLSRGAARKLDMIGAGTAQVEAEILSKP